MDRWWDADLEMANSRKMHRKHLNGRSEMILRPSDFGFCFFVHPYDYPARQDQRATSHEGE